MSSGGFGSGPSRPCEWPAKRLRGRPVSRTVTLRRARPSCRAPARPAKLPPMMMTSSMVMGSVLWMEEFGLGLAGRSDGGGAFLQPPAVGMADEPLGMPPRENDCMDAWVAVDSVHERLQLIGDVEAEQAVRVAVD